MGKAYFLGDGVPQDYAKAYHYLSIAYYKQDSKWGAFYLAKCCFYGWGTPQDYGQAFRFLSYVSQKIDEADYMRGVIYAQGLGGIQEDIPTGVTYLQKAGNFPKAKEELRRYKRTLFGKWVRRG